MANCVSCTMEGDNLYSVLETLVLRSHWNIPMKNYFDINLCINLKHLDCDWTIVAISDLSSKLSKLNKLILSSLTDFNIDDVIARNLTYLKINHSQKTFDFSKYTKVKVLILWQVKFINIDKLTQLKHLCYELEEYDDKIFVDSCNHTNLTCLNLNNCLFSNLFRLTKLNVLILNNINYLHIEQIWNKDLMYMSKLTRLDLLSNDDIRHENKIFDSNKLNHVINLKHFCCNFVLDDLSVLKSVNRLAFEYDSHRHVIGKLTKLRNILIMNNVSNVDCSELHRLVFVDEKQINRHPKMKIMN